MFDFLPDILTNNWGEIATVGMGVMGAYGVKVKAAVGHVKAAIKELEDVRDVTTAAIADKEITAEEAERIGKEVTEAIRAVHTATASVMSVLPASLRKEVPVQVTV